MAEERLVDKCETSTELTTILAVVDTENALKKEVNERGKESRRNHD